MKYRLLLAGKNHSTMDDFFYVMNESFECLTTSVRSADILNHINCFHPDAFVYCMSAETKDTIMNLINALDELDMEKVEEILSAMGSYRYESQQKELYEKLKELVSEYDVDRCEETILKWEELMNQD